MTRMLGATTVSEIGTSGHKGHYSHARKPDIKDPHNWRAGTCQSTHRTAMHLTPVPVVSLSLQVLRRSTGLIKHLKLHWVPSMPQASSNLASDSPGSCCRVAGNLAAPCRPTFACRAPSKVCYKKQGSTGARITAGPQANSSHDSMLRGRPSGHAELQQPATHAAICCLTLRNTTSTTMQLGWSALHAHYQPTTQYAAAKTKDATQAAATDR
jgi:hypothetical protein